MKKFLILGLVFIATSLSAQTVELMGKLNDLMAERTKLEESVTFAHNVGYYSVVSNYYMNYIFATYPGSEEDYDKLVAKKVEELKVNTLRLQEVVQDLDQYEITLDPEAQAKLYTAKRSLYAEWKASSGVSFYDTAELRSSLLKYLGKKYAIFQSLNSLVEEAHTKCREIHRILGPQDLIIQAKIFAYYVSKLDKGSITMQSDVLFAVMLQSSLLKNLDRVSDAGIDVDLIVNYSDMLYKVIDLGCPGSSPELKAEKESYLNDVAKTKAEFKLIKAGVIK
ncbi:MAG: hypothetical protein WCQ53_08800 [bacterium]